MKNSVVSFGFTGFSLLVLLLAACSFEIPEKVHVTGSPQYVANLGSSSIKAFKLKEHFGIEEINDVFNKEGKSTGFKTYEYAGPSLTEMTYLLHYKPAPIELSLDTEAFKFNKNSPQVITLASVNMPDIEDYISYINFPYNIGSLSLNSVPLNVLSSELIASTWDVSFTKAVIGEGSILISAVNYDFKDVTIELKKNDGTSTSTPGPIFPASSSEGQTQYDLAGKEILPGTKIHFGGTLRASPPVSGSGTITVTTNPNIETFSSIEIPAGTTNVTSDKKEFELNLTGIAEWVESLKFNEFGIQIGFSDNFIPVAGITVTVSSEPSDLLGNPIKEEIDETNYKEFYQERKGKITLPRPGELEIDPDAVWEVKLEDYEPSYKPKIKIKSEFPGPLTFYDVPAGFNGVLTIKPEPIFDWSEVVVNPTKMIEEMDKTSDSNYDLNYEFPDASQAPIDLSEFFNSLKDAIGDDADKIKLKEADLYLYIDSSGDLLKKMETKFKLTADYDSTLEVLTDPNDTGYAVLDDNFSGAPDFSKTENMVYKDPLPVQYEPISFAKVINTKPTPTEFRLKAEVELPDKFVPISRGTDYSVSIAPQIVIMLPLSLQVDRDPGQDLDDYAALNLNKLLYDEGENGGFEKKDLFDRESADDQEDLFEFLENINLHINYNNQLSQEGGTLKLSIPKTNRSLPFEIESGIGSTSFALSRSDIAWPFEPDLQLLIFAPAPGNTGSLTLMSGDPSFSITSMSVTAGMVIDKTY
jgi:hypothetical protein